MKINSISAIASTYPSRLEPLTARPKTLYYKGTLPDYSLGVAIIGTRKPTPYGTQVTTALAERLSERGAVIISGLAHGIDKIAHEGALSSRGKTLAVLACGLDQVYPAAHRGLADRILSSGGALISEYEPGTPPLQHRFLERNRIVSGLADIVIVTEAGLRSGTMNTVSHALEQGRDVYAVPGPITSPMSAGCNALIAQGATPVVSVEGFVDQILPSKTLSQASLYGDNAAEQVILELLASGTSEGEELQSKSQLEPSNYAQTITMLEIKGMIKNLGANRWGI